MKKIYHELTCEQWYKLESYLEVRKIQSQISLLQGFHRSTISREITWNVAKRGIGAKVYSADKAQTKTDKRHHLKQKQTKFSLPLKERMLDWMNIKRYSPELVAKQWEIDGMRGLVMNVFMILFGLASIVKSELIKDSKKLTSS
jgi:IS30 family transposase